MLFLYIIIHVEKAVKYLLKMEIFIFTDTCNYKYVLKLIFIILVVNMDLFYFLLKQRSGLSFFL